MEPAPKAIVLSQLQGCQHGEACFGKASCKSKYTTLALA